MGVVPIASTSLIFDILARDKASAVFRKLGSEVKKTGDDTEKFAAVAKVGLAAVGGAALTFGAAAIKSGGDFDKTMRQVAAVTGEPRKGLEGLSRLALKMGADTKFSAQEAGAAMLELAKGGLTTAEIRAGALDSTLTLAAAGGLELGRAAAFVSKGLNTFGLDARDAGAVAAALAGGANASAASVEDMGAALSQVGPGARNAGLSIQETTGILAAFSNSGIEGSDAGTSLKTMLTRLVPTTAASATAMRQLGLDFTDATGAFLPMRDVAQQLQDRLAGLSEEERTRALATIFGSDATRAATVLMNEGAAGLDKYTKATSNQSAATRLAKSSMEGQSGAFEQFRGSVDTLLTTVGTQLVPLTTKAALFGTTLVNGVVPAFQLLGRTIPTPVLKVLAVILGTLTAAIIAQTAATMAARVATAAWSATTGLFTTVKTAEGVVISRGTVARLAHNVATIAGKVATVAVTIATKAYTVAQWLLNAALRANPIGLVITGLAALAVGIKIAYDRSSTFRGIVDRLWQALKTAGSWVVDTGRKVGTWITDKFNAAGDKLGDFIDAMKSFRLPGWVKTLSDMAGGIGSGLRSAARAVRDRLPFGDGPGRVAGGNTLRRVQPLLSGGLRVTSTYRSPARNRAAGGSPTSYHMDRDNPAVDIGGPTGQLDALHARLRAMGGWRELLWRVPNHFDHIHVAHQGGMVSSSWPTLPGLRRDERPAILQTGERVQSRAEVALPLTGGRGHGGGDLYLTVNVNGSVLSERDLLGVVRDGFVRMKRNGVALGF